MPRKPANLQYGVDEVPPPSVIIVNALQYVAVLAAFLVYPLIMAREAHASEDVIDSVLSWSMIILAIGTTMQALPKGPLGSSYLAPSTMTAVYVPPSLEAVRLGGLPLMAGMTIFGGIVEAVLSRSMHRLRALLPPELAGVVIMLVAIGNGAVGFRYLLTPGSTPPDARHWVTVATTLLVTVVLSVWGKGILRASCALVGMGVGYVVALFLGLVPHDQLAALMDLAPVQLPRTDYFAWSFNALMIVPFLIAALANTLKGAALLATAERIGDADWVRPNMTRIGGGVLADGITTVLSGATCVFGVNISAPSVGLIEASGVASRVVAYAISAIFVVMAFVPDVIRLFTLMPAAVIGATFLFTSCAILKGGIETIASRMLDARRTLVVGLSLLNGVAVEAFPGFFNAAPAGIAPLVGSPLVLGTAVGFILNAVFRIGTRRRAALAIDPRAIDFDAIHSFMDGRGELWGARRAVITRANYAAQQLVEVIADNCGPRGPITLSGSFDEFDLTVEARYSGDLLVLPERRPTPDEIRDHEDGVRMLAGFLLRHNADRSASSRRGDVCTVQFHFHH
ncbi:MAG TPA: solute carrier family 23 protein [Acetobacteraceae bacterium]|jgi:NCS2 family nucleobase:cation symporter-2|nr:solute carrier family 23 protein [Acetobacteraceae bacterium]